jgi:poly-gamma-glutamate system protein
MMNNQRRRRTVSKQWFPSILELAIVCVVGMAMIILSHQVKGPSGVPSQQMSLAAETMQSATEILVAYREENGPPINPSTDINGTGLIGDYFSSITTTVGNLEAKRTTTNPNMAGLVAGLLLEAGAQLGDYIAVGASGSFPALILATASAAQALDLRMGLILSLGSSQFGANRPEFTWIEMERVLSDAGVVVAEPVAVSLGGDLDIARDLGVDARNLLTEKIDALGASLIDESELQANVRQRMSIYQEGAGGDEIAAFVSIGGGWATMGIDPSVLTIAPGLIQSVGSPSDETGGVIHAMDESGVPIIHLLNMKALVQQFGLPWDPSPLPAPGERMAGLGDDSARQSWFLVGCLVLAIVWIGSIATRRRNRLSL